METIKMICYLYFDKNDVCLYIGITQDFKKRQQGHKQTFWWQFQERHELVTIPDNIEPSVYEGAMIDEFLPIFNKHHYEAPKFNKSKNRSLDYIKQTLIGDLEYLENRNKNLLIELENRNNRIQEVEFQGKKIIEGLNHQLDQSLQELRFYKEMSQKKKISFFAALVLKKIATK
jgi:predicted GIY-YIG superfamily endonuclease